MSEQHNAEFNELIYRAVSEASRVSNTEAPFTSQFKDTTMEPIAVAGERDNDIYNLGVMDGALHVIDKLHEGGYKIINLDGEPLQPSLEEGSFTKDYFSKKYWEQVSS